MRIKHVSAMLCLASSAALATSLPATTDRFPHLQPHSEEGATYLCGGIGESESAFMKQVARDYDAMLTFSSSNGAYLADVSVEISDQRGRHILGGLCGGPIMLIDVQQAGTYRIRAEFEGQAQSRTVHIRPRGHTRQVIVWPNENARSPTQVIEPTTASSSR